jgi:hypothetical protein
VRPVQRETAPRRAHRGRGDEQTLAAAVSVIVYSWSIARRAGALAQLEFLDLAGRGLGMARSGCRVAQPASSDLQCAISVGASTSAPARLDVGERRLAPFRIGPRTTAQASRGWR